jgi:hypothetical protein
MAATAVNEADAIRLVRYSKVADPADKVEVKGPVRDDVMKAAFGEHRDGTVVIRGDWTWINDKAAPRMIQNRPTLVKTGEFRLQ